MWITFAHSELALAAAGLAAVPLLIHLLSQRRYRREPWAAMAFLLAAQQRSRRRMQIEQYALLAMRTLIVLALGLAVARPAMREGFAARAAGRSLMDHVIVLDDTLSMQALREDGRSAFDAARETARELIRRRNPGDAFGLVLFSGGGRAVVDRPTADAARLERLLSELTCSCESAAADGALLAAADVLERGDAPADCRCATVLTDAAANTWRPSEQGLSAAAAARPRADESTAPQLDRAAQAEHAVKTERAAQAERAAGAGGIFAALARLGDPARRFVIDVGPNNRGNAALVELRAVGGWVAPGLPLTIEAVVRTCDLRLPADAAVELRLDGRMAQRVPIGAAAQRGERRLTTKLLLDRGGAHVISARIEPGGDALPIDDERTAVLLAQDRLPLLLVSGGAAGGPADDPLFYLQSALSPEADGAAGARMPPLFEPRESNESELASQSLSGVRAVVLADVARVSERDAARLERFVRDGGGLIVALGRRCDPASYSALSALLPATLEKIVAPAEPGQKGAAGGHRLKSIDWSHPILADLYGHDGGGLTTAAVRGYARIAPATKAAHAQSDDTRESHSNARDAEVRTILELDNGDALLLERRVGRGRVLLWCSSLDMSWTDLPAKPDFVPLAMNLAAYAAGGDDAAFNVSVGRPLELEPSRDQEPRGDAHRAHAAPAVSVRRPDGRVDPALLIEESAAGGVLLRRVRYEHVDIPGAYDVAEGGGVQPVAAHTDPSESDLASLDEAQFRAAAGPLVWVADAGAFVARGAAAPRREASGALLVTLLVLLLGESLMAAVFGRR